MRSLLYLLILFLFAGCKGQPIRLFGEFKIVDPSLSKLRVYDADGMKRYLTNTQMSLEILGKRAIFLQTQDDKESWRMLFKGNLKRFLNRNNSPKKIPYKLNTRGLASVGSKPQELDSYIYRETELFTDREIGQRFGLKIIRDQKFVEAKEVERMTSCWFKHKEWKTGKKGTPYEVENMIKGHQNAVMKIETFQEVVTVEFYRKQMNKLAAIFVSRPNKVERVHKLKELDNCRGKSVF